MMKTTDEVGKNSQSARLQKLAGEAHASIGIGAFLLIGLFIVGGLFWQASKEQLAHIEAWNQYRLSSEGLVYGLQVYAATGQASLYQELQESWDASREQILTLQQDANESEATWIQEMNEQAEQLQQRNEQIIQALEAEEQEEAAAILFGDDYMQAYQEHDETTQQLIKATQEQITKEKQMLLIAQLLMAFAFACAFLHLIYRIRKTIRFSKEELMQPIQEVSDQMRALASGDLHSPLSLTADDSEVGKMVAAIQNMKQGMTGMITEISDLLEQMGKGNYRLTLQQEYVGEFVQIRESFECIIAKIKETVSTIQDVSEDICSGSAQLADAAEDLAGACIAQAGEVTDVMMLVNALSQNVEVNRREAEEAYKINALAESTLVAENLKMTELQEAMEQIMFCSQQIDEVIARLEGFARQTADLLILTQEQLQDKGLWDAEFDQMAQQITHVVQEFEQLAQEKEQALEKEREAAQKGVRIAKEAFVDMEDVMMGTQESGERVNKLMMLLAQEADSIGMISDTIEQVAGYVDNNSATSQETAAISEQQKAQVETVVELVHKFKV